jgi:hypothetical protein
MNGTFYRIYPVERHFHWSAAAAPSVSGCGRGTPDRGICVFCHDLPGGWLAAPDSSDFGQAAATVNGASIHNPAP